MTYGTTPYGVHAFGSGAAAPQPPTITLDIYPYGRAPYGAAPHGGISISTIQLPEAMLDASWSRLIIYSAVADHSLNVSWSRIVAGLIPRDLHALDVSWSRTIPYAANATHYLEIGYSLLGAPVQPHIGIRIRAQLTGSSESPPIADLPFSISSLEATLYRSTESYVRATVPNGFALLSGIEARQNGYLIFGIYRLYADGVERLLREVRVKFTDFRWDVGPRSTSVSLSGTGIVQFGSTKEVTIPHVTRRSRQMSGSIPQVLLEFELIELEHLAPGDTATYQTDSGIVIRLSVSCNEGRMMGSATVQ